MSNLSDWLAYQAGVAHEFEAHAERDGNDFQIVTLMFCRPQGVPLSEAVHMQRISSVRGGADALDELVESAFSDVMTRRLGANYPHQIHHDGPAPERSPHPSDSESPVVTSEGDGRG